MKKGPGNETTREFDSSWLLMQRDFGSRSAFVDYLKKTWIPHKKLICRAWTNDVMHFGNSSTQKYQIHY
jgi:hypothetical protein